MNITHSRIYVCNKEYYRQGQLLDLINYPHIENFKEMCSSLFSENQEYIYFDYDDIPSVYIGIHWISPNYFSLIRAVSLLDENKQRAFSVWLSCNKPDIEESQAAALIDTFLYCYEGIYANPSVFTSKYAKDHMNITSINNPKFDFNAYNNNLFGDQYLFTTEGYVFKRIPMYTG